jgi:hypothetical protein
LFFQIFYSFDFPLFVIFNHALLKDKVIPATGIMEALDRFVNVDVMDFPYAYSHENPFPLIDGEGASLINTSFNGVFSKAAAFLQ